MTAKTRKPKKRHNKTAKKVSKRVLDMIIIVHILSLNHCKVIYIRYFNYKINSWSIIYFLFYSSPPAINDAISIIDCATGPTYGSSFTLENPP